MEAGTDAVKPLRLFYSYSHRDEEFRQTLETHLSFLRRGGLIAEWHDRMIGAGGDWKGDIDRNLASADIVLLLVSADFIASDYCWSEEMTKALRRHEAGEARVVPVILRPCRWLSTPLAKVQAVPRDGKAVTDWLNRDAAFDDVAAAIERMIHELWQDRLRAAEEARRHAEHERQQAEAAAARAAEEQRLRREQEEQQRREREERQKREREEAEARRKAEEEERREAQRRREEDRQRHAEKERQKREREEAETRRKAEEEERERQWRARQSEEAKGEIAEKESEREAAETGVGAVDGETTKPLMRRGLIAGALVALVVAGIGAVFFGGELPEPVAVKPPTPVAAPTPVPAPDPKPAPQKSALKPGETFSDCPNCPEMVVIRGGTFTMGSPRNEEGRSNDEGPQRQVTIAPFAIGKTEVTFDQWDACVAAGGCNGYRPDDEWGRGSQPVINVSWQDAQAYVDWLAEKTGKPYRLPTEAEWEYAARAGTTTPFSFGSTISTVQANYDGNYVYGAGTKGEDRQRTVPAGSLPANPWGLYEVHGNLWEWVEDCYHDSYKGAPADGRAWVENSCSVRVFRGGSWSYLPGFLRSAYRGGLEPGYRNIAVGFRVARTLTL